MKSLFFLLPFFLFGATNLDYTFFYRPDAIEVELNFEAEDIHTTIAWPEFFDSDLAQGINNLKLIIDGIDAQYTQKENALHISHKPHALVSLKYTLPFPSQKHSLLYFFGDRFLLAPQYNNQEKLQVSFVWKDLPEDFEAICSFGLEKNLKITSTFFDLQECLFCLGNFTLTKIHIKEFPFYLVTPHYPSNVLDRLSLSAEKIAYKQRNIIHDADFPFFFFIHIPTEEANIYGEAKTNSLLVQSKNLETATPKDWENFIWVFSHEHFHTFLPYKILSGLEQNYDRLAWLVEGFTEYYAMISAFTSGCLSAEACQRLGEEIILDYENSPVNNVSEKEFLENRYSSYEMQKLPYQKGFLLALLWDYTIKTHSLNAHSLDDLLREIFTSVTEEKKVLSLDNIGLATKKYLKDQGIKDLNKYIIKGDLFPDLRPLLLNRLQENYK